MIWATVGFQSCFCWLFRASPSLAAKNIINLISVLTIWWCPCVVLSCVFGRGCLLWPVRSLGKTLLGFALLYSGSKVRFACYSRCLLSEIAQSCMTLWSRELWPTRLSIHSISQARVLEWIAISSSSGSSWPGDQTQVSLDFLFFFIPVPCNLSFSL